MTLEHQPAFWPVPYVCVQAATARVIWLCACVSYWPDRGLVFECVTCFYFFSGCRTLDGRQRCLIHVSSVYVFLTDRL